MEKIKIGLGFATGRKSFRKVLNAYVNVLNASRKLNPQNSNISLNLFVAYDLDYHNTQSTDYTNLNQQIVDTFDQIVFFGAKNALKTVSQDKYEQEFSSEDLRAVFGAGYAGKRNAILYAAMENKMDYLLFLDDDEYPMAVTRNSEICLWSGQNIVMNHLAEIPNVDYTNGFHCGYISPIPQIEFNEVLTEDNFKTFIKAISNDIINWDKMKNLMATGGVTYASTEVLKNKQSTEVFENNGCKFISGANLCINLTKPERTFPFYNPPGARGEDTFLSTMLKERTVKQIPCYAFHDGFSIYQALLEGALPLQLAPITAKTPELITRFLNACIGWVRYKPLLVYITNPDAFEQEMDLIQQALTDTLPSLARFFNTDKFLEISNEFVKYRRNVKKHYKQFRSTAVTWSKLIDMLNS